MTVRDPTSEDMPKPGRYRHYKGQDYQVLGIAKHSETNEQLVVYRYLYGDQGLSVRPVEMFLESVEMGGEVIPRFSYIGPMLKGDSTANADGPTELPRQAEPTGDSGV